MNLTKRHVLLALAALGAGAAAPALAQDGAIDLSAGRAIGQAYLAANPGADIAALRQDLLPRGFSAESAGSLRLRARDDFAAGRVFIYQGWRLSETEARLFALLA